DHDPLSPAIAQLPLCRRGLAGEAPPARDVVRGELEAHVDAAHRAARPELTSPSKRDREAPDGRLFRFHAPPRMPSSQTIKSRVTSSRLLSLNSSCRASA